MKKTKTILSLTNLSLTNFWVTDIKKFPKLLFYLYTISTLTSLIKFI